MKRIIPVVAIGAMLALFPSSVGATASKKVIFKNTSGRCDSGPTSGTSTPSFAVIDFHNGNIGAAIRLQDQVPNTTYQIDLVQTPSGESCLQTPGETSLPGQTGVFVMLLTPFDILATKAVAISRPTPGWEGGVTNPASGCTAKVQVPYLDGNERVTAYTKVFCPQPTQLTIRSRLQSDYAFQDITVAQNGCSGNSCVVDGTRYFPLTCPKSSNRRQNQRYFSDIVFYPDGNAGAASKERSTGKVLSPFCAH